MRKLFILSVLSGIFFVSCDFFDDATIPVLNCDEEAVVDDVRYNQPPTVPFSISDVTLNGDCLEITIGASGCNPDNWKMNFVASEVVVETSPVQWNTKVELVHYELCLAAFQKTVSFDLTPLQLAGANQIQIGIDGWNTPILYQY